MAWAEPTHPSFTVDPDPKPRLLLEAPPPGLLRLLLLLSILVFQARAAPPRPARVPLLSNQPFIVFWGVPDSSCAGRPDPGALGLERGGRVALFYEDTLGQYPYFAAPDSPVSGGLPQHTRLDAHLQKTERDLDAAVPARRFLGLGVLRWREWSPLWARNGRKRRVYADASRALLRGFFPDWTAEEVERWSKVDFEASARSVLAETLREVTRLRPKALWGVAPYPTCSDGDPAHTSSANYSGRCSAADSALNEELAWLWRRSSALYPLLSLEKRQGGTRGARLFLSNQIAEALRVATLGGRAFDLPVFPLVRSVYASTNTFLSQADLVSTIGESAAMGTAGVIVWERREMKTERECQEVADFLRNVLGPYCVNVTTAARQCSASLCQGRGRCVRQNPGSSAFLHLAPPTEEEEKAAPDRSGPPGPADPDPAELWKKDFQCQWYQESDRDPSDRQTPRDGAPPTTTAVPVGKDASVSSPTGSDSSAMPAQEVPTDGGTRPFATLAPPTLLLLLLLGRILDL